MFYITTIITGLIAGSLHVLSGPDHLAAIAPIASSNPSKALKLGILWGLGHGLGVVFLGMLAQYFQNELDLDSIGLWSERIVGILLIGIGIWSLLQAKSLIVHQHHHNHDGTEHQHLHMHSNIDKGNTSQPTHGHSVFGVGWLHGMAGTGHLFGVLPSLALPSHAVPWYLGAYLMGAVCSMALFSWLLTGWLQNASQSKMKRMLQGTGVGAIIIGGLWIAFTLH